MGIEKMLRMYLVQCWFNLSDEGAEDAVLDSYRMYGRYYTEINREEMQNIIDAVNRIMAERPEVEQMKTGEIFPSKLAPVYIADGDRSLATLMK